MPTDGETLQATLQKRIAQWREKAAEERLEEDDAGIGWADGTEQCADELESDLVDYAHGRAPIYLDYSAIAAEVTRIRSVGIDTDPQHTLDENAGYLFTVIENLSVRLAVARAQEETKGEGR